MNKTNPLPSHIREWLDNHWNSVVLNSERIEQLIEEKNWQDAVTIAQVFDFVETKVNIMLAPKTNKRIDRIDRDSDLRLRILDYHLSVIIRLEPGEPGAALHTVKGLDCHVFRDDDGRYWIGGTVRDNVSSAITEFLRQLDKVATGLHSDKD